MALTVTRIVLNMHRPKPLFCLASLSLQFNTAPKIYDDTALNYFNLIPFDLVVYHGQYSNILKLLFIRANDCR